MLSVQDVEGLSVPLGLFVSKDENEDEVRHLYSRMGSQLIRFRFSQFNKIVDLLSKKPFAAKVDSKLYSNMFVICLTIVPETHHLPPGSTAGLLPVEISRTPKTRESTRTSTPGLPPFSRMLLLEPSTNTKTKLSLVQKVVQYCPI